MRDMCLLSNTPTDHGSLSMVKSLFHNPVEAFLLVNWSLESRIPYNNKIVERFYGTRRCRSIKKDIVGVRFSFPLRQIQKVTDQPGTP